jgi:heme-degrading monooxygenase HmoA
MTEDRRGRKARARRFLPVISTGAGTPGLFRVGTATYASGMSVVKINAIDVPAERAEEMAKRFAARVGEVEQMEGFEEFQLLRPDDSRTRWLVYTRWIDEASFQAWVSSSAFNRGHAQHQGPGGPVATGSEVWSFSVEQLVHRG